MKTIGKLLLVATLVLAPAAGAWAGKVSSEKQRTPAAAAGCCAEGAACCFEGSPCCR